MKRYVKEIANEFLNVKKYPETDKQKILEIVHYADRGLITSLEAVEAMLKVSQTRREIDAIREQYAKKR